MFRAGTENKLALPHERVIQDRYMNNRLRENWLQQTYNEQDLRREGPAALMQDYNRRVHGDPLERQTDFQGEYSRYNDAYRERMFDSLDALKNTYAGYGGKNASFVNQVRDMENYLYFNRPPPLNPLSQSVPYGFQGGQTTFARAGALPPPVIVSPQHSYFSPYVDHDRKLLRT